MFGFLKKNKESTAQTVPLSDDDEDVYTMVFDVVGESFNNSDGSSRQEIIEKYVHELEPAHLNFYDYKGELACGVYADDKLTMQVGNIPRDEVEELYEIATSGATINPLFYTKKKGSKGLYGVTIEILIKEY